MARPTNYRAVVFDVEGTLMDCVPLVLESWRTTLTEAGHPFNLQQLQPYSGMDGGWMLEQLLPDERSAERERLLKMQGDRYRSDFIERARPFPGVHELLAMLKRSGVAIAIATTCKRDELQFYDERMQVLKLADAIACGESVKHGKPDPALLRHCLDTLRVSDSAHALAVGDTPFDARAATTIGMHSAGVRTGGFSDDCLRQAGCHYLFDEARQIGELWDLQGFPDA